MAIPWSGAFAAEIYFEGFPGKDWRRLDVTSRMQALSLDGMTVYIGGTIEAGDTDQLKDIHALVPIHTLHISSPGGLVAEAVKLAKFADTYAISVETEYRFQCEHGSKSSNYPADGQCGCASACALIWLAAPVRRGDDVRIHRPYFAKTEFAALDDAEAQSAYTAAIGQVRAMLSARGYSGEFMTRLFNTPREKAERIRREESDTLPVDTALDELASARCYGDRAENLAAYHAHKEKLKDVSRMVKSLRASLPGDVILGELAKDDYYGPILRDLEKAEREQTALETAIRDLEPVQRTFNSCKAEERRKVSLRRSGERLSPQLRAKLEKFAGLVSLNADLATLVPSDPDTGAPLAMYTEEMTALRAELAAHLPPGIWRYVTGQD
ncbi:MAG: hypothetical protein K8F92_20425 [Hyphomicrobium sp.]|uniref:hypothetical protein n=1 Tax=Hyphomicrobium sp. TaxID=82 RepID=UPI00132118D1|nr:hypothetical protein [Hyphomicrobium sp.]KAB2941352.1 MAG: hypothetical protein F9K20_09615 [Hyphomicrobium sp.]MBZ0212000.1 hypothetical protein [Hyphomicrobium sp.]